MLLEELRKAAMQEGKKQCCRYFGGLVLFSSGLYILLDSAMKAGGALGKVDLIDKVNDLVK